MASTRDRRRDQLLARIGDQRCTRVGDQRDGTSLLEGSENGVDPADLVMRMERGRLLSNLEVIEQNPGSSGVLGEHPVDLPENPKCPQGHVLEVTDRCRDDVERAHPLP